MSKTISAYLSFDGNCREAMQFYQQCLGGELTLLTVNSTPMAHEFPADKQDQIIHSALIHDNMTLMATDMGTSKITHGNTVSLSLACDTLDELHHAFTKLSDGATIINPPHEFFSGTMAVLNDKHGFNWMLYSDKK